MEETKENSILIVDDDVPNIMALTDILSRDYTIFAAKDGRRAIKAAEERLPDLILLDVLMPDMDGYTVIAELKKSKKTQNIPVIFITGLGSSEDEKRGLALGATDYISKPFSPEIVRLRVKNQLTIINQMRTLDKRLKQQTLMTSVSQSFLADARIDSLFTNTLCMIGEFMEVAQIFLYILKENSNILVCQNEWLNPALNLDTHIGSEMMLKGTMLSIDNNIIITPIHIKGKVEAVIYFSKEESSRNWNESDINLAILVANIFSGVFERDLMERIIMSQELAERSSRAKSEFLSRISHEMRTPMNAIIGMTHLAQNTDEHEKLMEYLGKAGSASNHLLRLIDDVLDMYDIGENKFNLASGEFCFSDMIRVSLDSVRIDIIEKRQTLLTNIEPSIPEILVGDGKRLGQVIGNLLSNACKFTQEQGSICLNALVFGIDDDTAVIQIEVADNGIGISKEQQENLFTPFEQADGGINRKFEGVGLGLSISRHIVEMMDGQIWVESEPGKGSKFVVRVKLRIQASGTKENGSVSFSGKTILLVDDNEINREIIIAILEDTKIQIECAVSGRNALEIFSSAPDRFDMILMDINMPEMDGVEATRRIRTLESKNSAAVPIIAMTANVLSGEVEKYLSAGMNDHVGKPVDFDNLLRVLKKYL